MTDMGFLAAVTGCGFALTVVWMLSLERSIAAIERSIAVIEKALDLQWDFIKSLDRQAGHALEQDRLQFGLNQKDVSDETCRLGIGGDE